MVAKRALWMLLALSACAVGCATTASAPRSTSTPVASATLAPSATPEPSATPPPPPTPLDTSAYPAESVGYAISWPQCRGPYPDEPFDFGIIGVTNGQAFTRNPCFADEYRWAERGRYHPSIYMNTNYDEAVRANSDMEACGADASCRAYQYGRAMAEYAYAFAASVDGVAPVWWLDVQIVSVWSLDLTLNAESIRGAGDYLKSKRIRVGISSTSFQWATVAGGALHNLPVWDASALDADMAATFCAEGKDFGGGGTEQIAYVEQFETVVACGGAVR
jgi:hypothetical protein